MSTEDSSTRPAGMGFPFDALVDDLCRAFSGGVDGPWPDARFEAFALRVFRWQYGANAVYRAFCDARGTTPEGVRTWTEVPAVPAAAFKHLPLVSAPEGERPERVFRTSGTTEQVVRGEHHVPRLALYRASLLPTFARALVPDGGRLRFLSLVPPPERQPDSSLSTMVGEAMTAFGAEGSGWFADPQAGLDLDALAAALDAAERDGRPVLIVGAAFALVHWLDALEARGGPARRWRLPEGSRLMETGGFKGRSRAVPREALYAQLADRLGVAPGWMVNEYGMTELLSQYYDAVAGRAPGVGAPLGEALAARRHVPPPWLRFRVLDPSSLAPLPDGEVGVIAHFDLANAGSVAAILTEDLGVREGDGLRLIGRAAGAEPRGCSIAMDELLSAAGEAS